MEILPKKYTVLFIAAVFLVLFGVMVYSLWPKSRQAPPSQYEQELSQIQTQSESNETASIEKDLQETDFTGLDKELQDIEAELN